MRDNPTKPRLDHATLTVTNGRTRIETQRADIRMSVRARICQFETVCTSGVRRIERAAAIRPATIRQMREQQFCGSWGNRFIR